MCLDNPAADRQPQAHALALPTRAPAEQAISMASRSVHRHVPMLDHTSWLRRPLSWSLVRARCALPVPVSPCGWRTVSSHWADSPPFRDDRNADRIALSNTSSWKGLYKKSTAPACNACARVASSAWAVIKMTGTPGRSSAASVCRRSDRRCPAAGRPVKSPPRRRTLPS
jgi:hypothetical protein